jgi:peptidoglycan/xylan/chitin deacetylase (PgdA/CDA1 family)
VKTTAFVPLAAILALSFWHEAEPARAPAPPPTLQVALTFDDGPKTNPTPLMSPWDRNQALLRHLAKVGAPAALFVTVHNGADTPEGRALLEAWGAAGHRIGNHTVTHPDLDAEKTTLAAYEQEILDCDKVISTVPGYRPWFRFPFLREGNTPAKRDGMRAFLNARGWRNAYVTLDTSDWRLDDRLAKVLARNPAADLSPIREAYLSHVRQRAGAYRDLSRRLLDRDIPQVMLLHHNLLNALFLGDVIETLRREGFTLVDPEKAYQDPVYRLEPDRPAPGQSLLLSLARSRGWKLMPEFERLMDDGDFEITALEKLGY